MKKFFTLAILLLATIVCGKAQNVQLHYDFGGALYDKDLDGRPALTSTVEMFRADKWGSTYFFIDMDYKKEGVASAYWEIARELKFWQPPFSVHVEYNGGLMKGGSYNNAYLGGLTFTPMYKYIQKHRSPNNFQLTGTWYIHFAKNGLCTFSGFADWWREKNDHGNFIFLSEPQIWVNLNKLKGVDDKLKLSVGSEVELSHNFGGRNGFYTIPTLAIKWTFD